MKLWIFANLYTKPLIFRQMPVQHVELDGSHSVQLTFKNFDRLKMTTGIDQQTSPRKTRFVLDANDRNEIAALVAFDQLQKSFQTPQSTHDRIGFQVRLFVSHVERI